MVKKTDWKVLEMPEQTEHFLLEKKLTANEIALIQEGFRPLEMEDKWFMYYENGKLFIHRSWTGYCIYVIEISENGILDVTVNRNQEQHRETDIKKDQMMSEILINRLIRQNGDNARLIEMYLGKKNSDLHEKDR